MRGVELFTSCVSERAQRGDNEETLLQRFGSLKRALTAASSALPKHPLLAAGKDTRKEQQPLSSASTRPCSAAASADDAQYPELVTSQITATNSSARSSYRMLRAATTRALHAARALSAPAQKKTNRALHAARALSAPARTAAEVVRLPSRRS